MNILENWESGFQGMKTTITEKGRHVFCCNRREGNKLGSDDRFVSVMVAGWQSSPQMAVTF